MKPQCYEREKSRRRIRRLTDTSALPATRSLEEALAAQAAGADYILLGPTFATPSKLPYGPPLGLAKLREVTLHVSIPVFALGGVTLDRAAECRQNGAAGIAGIRLFQDCDSIEALVRELRAVKGS